MKRFITFILVGVLVTSCSLQIEKRRYMKGYYVNFSGENSGKQVKKKEIAAVADPGKNDISTVGISKNQHGVSEPITLNAEDATTSLLIQSDSYIEQRGKKEFSKVKAVPVVSETKTNHKFSSQKTIPVAKNKPKNSDGMFLFLSGILAAAVAMVFRPVVSHSRKMGYWALNNRKAMWGLHFLMHTALASTGFYLGKNLLDAGVVTSAVSTYTLVGLASVIALLYPNRKAKTGFFRNTYNKQKWFALSIALTGLLSFINLGNRYASDKYLDETYAAISVTDANLIHNTVTSLASPDEVKKDDLSDSDRKALAALAIVACVLICILIAIGSCALACSGQTALAIALLVIGLPLVIIGFASIVRRTLEPVRAKKRGQDAVNPW